MLVDSILMAFCWWNCASLIPFKIGIKDNILGIYDDLSISTSHFIGNINFFLKINFPLYFIILNAIVNYMIFYVVLLKIERKATIYTWILCLDFYIATFLYWACFKIRRIVVLFFDHNWYILISFFQVRCNLR